MSPLRTLLVLTILALLTITLGYVAACAFTPVRPCRRCHGLGRYRTGRGHLWHRCRHCRGTGARVRIGRLLWTELRRTHSRGTR